MKLDQHTLFLREQHSFFAGTIHWVERQLPKVCPGMGTKLCKAWFKLFYFTFISIISRFTQMGFALYMFILVYDSLCTLKPSIGSMH